MDYAVFKTGGKQYRVKPGDTLDVEKLSAAVDSIAEFGEVLAISNNGEVTFCSPMIEGARVLARVDSHYKDKKLMVFKYKSKTRYRRKKGHRQIYTRLVIQDIQSEPPAPPAPPRRRRTRTRAAVAQEEGSAENGS